jgi:hypothetical protein
MELPQWNCRNGIAAMELPQWNCHNGIATMELPQWNCARPLFCVTPSRCGPALAAMNRDATFSVRHNLLIPSLCTQIGVQYGIAFHGVFFTKKVQY